MNLLKKETLNMPEINNSNSLSASYERDMEELMRILSEAQADVLAGRVAPIEETFANARKMLLKWQDKSEKQFSPQRR